MFLETGVVQSTVDYSTQKAAQSAFDTDKSYATSANYHSKSLFFIYYIPLFIYYIPSLQNNVCYLFV